MAKTRLVFDAGPLLLSFTSDERPRKLLREVAAGIVEGYTCDPAMAELYYKTCEGLGRETAKLRYLSIRNSALEVVATDDALTQAAGSLKCACRGRISLADAYVIAVTKRLGGTLVTTDHALKELKLVDIRLLQIS